MIKLSNYSRIFKALSNEKRLKIFMMIYNQCYSPEGEKESHFKIETSSCCPVTGVVEKAFTKICGCMNLSKSTISHHFKELQNAELITCERDGQTFHCKVNEETVATIREFLK